MKKCLFKQKLVDKRTNREYVICKRDNSRRNGCKDDCPHRRSNNLLEQIMKKVR